MINIYCALYHEAHTLIRAFDLKKEIKHKHFQVFANESEGVRLVLTGAGSVAAATAVAEISTYYPPEKTDLLLNFGSCAAAELTTGNIFLCNKITEAPTGRTFYPDVIYRHNFSEAAIVSAAKVMSREELLACGGLCDMEAAAIYQAGNYYYSLHQMLFLKVVTDHGMAANETVDAQAFDLLLNEAAEKLFPFIIKLKEAEEGVQESEKAQHELRVKADADTHELSEELHCSVTMTSELTQLLFYCRLTGKNYALMVEEYRRKGLLPAKDKREGKRLLEELKAKLL